RQIAETTPQKGGYFARSKREEVFGWDGRNPSKGIVFFDLSDQYHELGHSWGPFVAFVDNLGDCSVNGKKAFRALGRYHLSWMPPPRRSKK
ncbi:hypothetical protein AB9F29_22720, partial [Falsihalocynthiibacter sp. S25ZX9]|uniref:hypothetical protein n=1 Tax=Falsihalocynthiibacter sp. S25ZX9 TaxID=3240870 RepID=UPI0035102B2C